VEIAGIVRDIAWEDNDGVAPDLTGSVAGWGLSLSSNLKPSEANVLRLQAVVGDGIENYMNDAPVDVAPKPTNNPNKPIEGEALPLVGVVAFLDHTWNAKYSSSIGYSQLTIDNSAGEAAGAVPPRHEPLAHLP